MNKMGKRFLSLMLAVMFVLSMNTAVFAYDTSFGGGVDQVPADQWRLIETYHWVVRGETLEGIANKYGTTVEQIKLHNQAYFADLGLRNTTNGVTTVLEYGIRLKIYDQVQVIHYVRRGDTLAKLAGGSLKWGNFTLTTTVQAIKEENAAWFASLASLNETMGSTFPLVESDQIFNATHVDPLYGDMIRSGATFAGLPLYITVPVQLTSWTVGSPYQHLVLTWLENDRETVATVVPHQLPTYNALPTNNLVVGVESGKWTLGVFEETLNATPVNSRYVTGIYDRGNATVVADATVGAKRLVASKYTIVYANSTGNTQKDGLQFNKGDQVYLTGVAENGRVQVYCKGNRLGWINTTDVEWQ